jgi:hypothetical protein
MRKSGLWLAAMAMMACLTPLAAMAADDKAPAAGGEMDAATSAWMKYSIPGEHHKHLEKFVGKWTTTIKMWMDPSQPAMESKGTVECAPLLGGRFFRSDYKGDMMGMLFEGIGIDGYDIYKGKYFSTWIDNLGTMMASTTGACNASGSERTMVGTWDDPMSGLKNQTYKSVIKLTGPDSHTFEMYNATSGKDVKMMEVTATRVK